MSVANDIPSDAIAAAVEAVARDRIMPRYRALHAAMVRRKRGEEVVTIADLEAEDDLSERLARLLPGSVVVGEEAVSRRPDLLDLLTGEAPVWIIDPLDGTANFIDGSPDFSIMVALVQGGVTLAAWIHAPALRHTAIGLRGRGAFLNGRRLGVAPRRPVGELRVAVTHPAFQTDQDRALFARLGESGLRMSPSRGAGLEYIDLARGATDAVVFTWEKPWDHVAGLLLQAEAGGSSATRQGLPFNPAGGNALPLVAASNAHALGWLRAAIQASSA